MSEYIPKILQRKPKKTKEELLREELDLRRRAHFVKRGVP